MHWAKSEDVISAPHECYDPEIRVQPHWTIASLSDRRAYPALAPSKHPVRRAYPALSFT